MIGAIIFLACVVLVLIISASLMICKKCRRVHDTKEDEENCKGER